MHHEKRLVDFLKGIRFNYNVGLGMCILPLTAYPLWKTRTFLRFFAGQKNLTMEEGAWPEVQ